MNKSEKWQFIVETVNKYSLPVKEYLSDGIDPNNLTQMEEAKLSMVDVIFGIFEVQMMDSILQIDKGVVQSEHTEDNWKWANGMNREQMEIAEREFKLCQEYIGDIVPDEY